MAERDTNGDTGTKELKRRRIELFSAITILCFGLINYLDILGKKESSESDLTAQSMQSAAITELKSYIHTELERRDKSYDEKFQDLKDDIRELRMIQLARRRGAR